MNWQKAELSGTYGDFSQLPPGTAPEIAFSGRSNVGKSSLINRLLGRKSLARVSGTPGKTVTLNFYKVGGDGGNKAMFIVDLPGYGYAKTGKAERARFAKLTESYLKSGRIALLTQLIDFRHPPTENDLTMLDFLKESGIPYAIALTKADKLNKSERAERLSDMATRFPGAKIIPFSSATGEGADELRGIIEGFT